MVFYNKEIFNDTFWYPKKYWYKNVANIPRYFKQINFLVKHGYPEYATYQIDSWFIYTIRAILTEYKSLHNSVPILIEDSVYSLNEKMWEDIIDRMIELLGLMDESNPKYDTLESCEDFLKTTADIDAAKNKFFKLFSKHFYNLWD